jgi:NAD(P)-dependent dehydrogenase (short-subunit alcohol dehydrogenase family)
MDGSLRGRVALVTGGGKGIGAHYVQALAGYGAKVAAADIDQAAAESTAARLTSEAAPRSSACRSTWPTRRACSARWPRRSSASGGWTSW